MSPTLNTTPPIYSLGNEKKKKDIKGYLIPSLIIVAGIGSGFLLSRTVEKSLPKPASNTMITDNKTTPATNGNSTLNQVFSDSAEGELQENTSKTEGSYKLVRPGGDSQTVYLTSSVLDLSTYVGKKVKVMGQTFAAKKAGWLMDVGKIEVQQ